MYDETLALTGMGTIMLGSVALDLWWVAAGTAVIIGAGVVISRIGRRHATR